LLLLVVNNHGIGVAANIVDAEYIMKSAASSLDANSAAVVPAPSLVMASQNGPPAAAAGQQQSPAAPAPRTDWSWSPVSNGLNQKRFLLFQGVTTVIWAGITATEQILMKGRAGKLTVLKNMDQDIFTKIITGLEKGMQLASGPGIILWANGFIMVIRGSLLLQSSGLPDSEVTANIIIITCFVFALFALNVTIAILAANGDKYKIMGTMLGFLGVPIFSFSIAGIVAFNPGNYWLLIVTLLCFAGIVIYKIYREWNRAQNGKKMKALLKSEEKLLRKQGGWDVLKQGLAEPKLSSSRTHFHCNPFMLAPAPHGHTPVPPSSTTLYESRCEYNIKAGDEYSPIGILVLTLTCSTAEVCTLSAAKKGSRTKVLEGWNFFGTGRLVGVDKAIVQAAKDIEKKSSGDRKNPLNVLTAAIKEISPVGV